MTPHNVLIIGDHINTLRFLRRLLMEHNFEVQMALDDQEVRNFLSRDCFDVHILDLDFKNAEIDVVALCREMKEISPSPILVLHSERIPEKEKAVLSEIADGFIEKPFNKDLLIVQTKARLRSRFSKKNDVVREKLVAISEDFIIDHDRHEMWIRDKNIHLTPTEFTLLSFLIKHEGKVMSRKEILEAVWGEYYIGEYSILRVYISQLRKKIEADSADPQYLFTEPRIGYRLELKRPKSPG